MKVGNRLIDFSQPYKFHTLALGWKFFEKKPKFKTGEAEIECEKTVKLLGIEIDYNLMYDIHIRLPCVRKLHNRLMF